MTSNADRSLTFGAYLDAWYQERAPRLAKTTRQRYPGIIRRFDALADRPLGELTQSELQGVVDGLSAEGLAPRSVRVMASVIKAALADAQRDRLTLTHLGAGLKTPRIERTGRPSAFSAEEVTRLIESASVVKRGGAAWMHWYGPMIITAIYTGMRAGELRGLMWDDIDLFGEHDDGGSDQGPVRGLIHVTAQIPMNRAYSERVRLKTGTSARSLPVTVDLADLLTTHQERLETHRMRRHPRRWRDMGLVFPTPSGGPANPDAVRQTLATLAGSAGVQTRPTMHALRHTYASHALDSGLSTHILAAMLGHGSPDTTWAAYYDPTKAGLEAAARATHRATHRGAS